MQHVIEETSIAGRVTEVVTDRMWAVIARRTTNKGSRYERVTDLPVFYLDPRVQGIANRAHARRIAGEILGVDTPGCGIVFDVHLV